MKKTILYAAVAAAIAAVAAVAIVGCNGDLGSGNEKMDEFLEKFRGVEDTTIRRYTVRFDGNANVGNPTGTPPASQKVRAGNQITLPDKGGLSNHPYAFAGWKDENGRKYGVGSSYKPTSDITLYADWLDDVNLYEVTVSNAGSGAYGGGSYHYRDIVTIYAGTAPEGQRFKNWTTTSNGVAFASAGSPTTTFTMPPNGVTVTANFEEIPPNQYPVTVVSAGAGASSGSSYMAGAQVTINAGADPFGHRFQNWTVTDGGVGLANANSRTTTFIMPAEAVTVKANFVEVPTYRVVVMSDGIGASKDSSYREGDTVTIRAGTTPSADKRFKGWTVTSGGVTLGNADSATTKFIMPANDVKVTANFGANTYTVTVVAGAGAMGSGEYSPGATVNIKAGTAPTGFTFKCWTSSNSNVIFADANSATTTFTMPSAAVTVMASFWFTDSRDGQTYGTVTIGDKTWMTENLSYQTPSGSWCYADSPDSCAKYGRLYDWNTALAVCPTGYHLPSLQEWGELAIAAGGTGTYGQFGTAGVTLKAKSGWYNNNTGSPQGNGTDVFGFSALPGGYRSTNGSFYSAGNGGNWWTASDSESSGGNACRRNMNYLDGTVGLIYDSKGDGFSVRCIADD